MGIEIEIIAWSSWKVSLLLNRLLRLGGGATVVGGAWSLLLQVRRAKEAIRWLLPLLIVLPDLFTSVAWGEAPFIPREVRHNFSWQETATAAGFRLLIGFFRALLLACLAFSIYLAPGWRVQHHLLAVGCSAKETGRSLSFGWTQNRE